MSQNDSIDRRKFLCAAVGIAAAQPARKVRYGIVGAGNRGRNTHLQIALKYLPAEVEVAAICDVTRANLQLALDLFPGAKGYEDYHEMLASEPGLDAVIVVVPNYLHADVTVAAFEAGKHVLVEKPMATHLADADRMIQAARQKDRLLFVGLQSRYSVVYEHMAKLIRDGAIGNVEYIHAHLFRSDWNPLSWRYKDPATGKETNWRFLTKTSGSSLMEDGIHELDVVHWLAGADPTRIQAQGGNCVLKDRETIDNAGLLIEFGNGARCVFEYTIFAPGVQNNRSFRILGSKAEMTLEKGDIVIRPYRGQPGKPQQIPAPHVLPGEAAWWKKNAEGVNTDIETVRLHKAFLASITGGAPVFASGQVGKDAAHIALAAERSLRTGRVLRWEDIKEL